MQKLVCKDYAEMSRAAAMLVAGEIEKKPNLIIGLATGSTPLGMYQDLIQKYKNGEVDFSQVVSFNLDEYYPISKDNDQSYDYFMRVNLFDHINIKKENLHIPNGECTDVALECAQYDTMIKRAGGIDLQILGIGPNGHIGFNEPAEWMDTKTNLVDLTEETIKANARFFESEADVPKKALTLGLKSIFSAKKIIVLVSGKNKAKALSEVFSMKVSTKNPASLLALHNDVLFIADEEAAQG